MSPSILGTVETMCEKVISNFKIEGVAGRYDTPVLFVHLLLI